MASGRIAPSALHSLARKYRVLALLRREGPRSRRIDLGVELTLLSREFPGALTELDVLPLDEIDRRLAAVERALATGRAETWMLWMTTYHEYMRAALFVRRRLGGRRALTARAAEDLATTVWAEAGARCDATFVASVATPPAGRLSELVVGRLGSELGVSPDAVLGALFSTSARRR